MDEGGQINTQYSLQCKKWLHGRVTSDIPPVKNTSSTLTKYIKE